ncbi:MAG: hypothetical protein E7211_13915 [Clostridium lundense]|nr:hypothetical protein [Clostridium lundense]
MQINDVDKYKEECGIVGVFSNKEIHYRLASPIIKSSCCLGIDISSKKELIGSHMTLEEMTSFIEVNSLGYISIDGFLSTLGHKKSACLKCFM